MADSAPRILGFAGSLRKDSFNKKLVRIAAMATLSSTLICANGRGIW